jgi:hypothetical protein
VPENVGVVSAVQYDVRDRYGEHGVIRKTGIPREEWNVFCANPVTLVYRACHVPGYRANHLVQV